MHPLLFPYAQRHAQTVALVREAAEERPGCNVAILLDTKGPEVRTGKLKTPEGIHLRAGQDLFISTDYSLKGDESAISCSYAALARTVRPGQTILAADGNVVMTVKECRDECVTFFLPLS